jgi:hypothetical protein
MTETKPNKEKMVSIWTWVGLILLIYGILIVGAGVYYISHPQPQVLGELNPSLWWGALMTISGVAFLLIPKFGKE